MRNLLVRFVHEDEGQDLIEYALLAGLITTAVVAVITTIGARVLALFTDLNTAIDAVGERLSGWGGSTNATGPAASHRLVGQRMNSTRIGSGIARLIEDEGGQDLLEYALLTGAITFGSVAFVLLMQLFMRSQYVQWQAGAQAAWEPCPPGGCP